MSAQYAFVTLVTSDYYLPGALVVAPALRELHPSPPSCTEEMDPREFHIICLVTPETVNVQTLKLLRRAFDVVIGVEVIEENTEEALKLLGRPDLKSVLTKLHVFRLKSYRKIIYLDADVLPLLPLSHLFYNASSFAAVPDVGWPDIFNSGVLVFTPGEDDFEKIMKTLRLEGSWDGGDQGVLNEWRGNDWERLSFTYNTTPTGAYTYVPAYKRFGSKIKVIHFIGPNKPWSQAQFRAPAASTQSTTSSADLPSNEQSSYAYSSLLDKWFSIFDKYYRSTAPVFSTIGSIMPSEIFVEGTCENAWDSRDRAAPNGGTPLALEALRKLALEGFGQIPTMEEGEGAYMTLPLEGRLDLMPLRRSHFRMLSLLSTTASRTSTSSLAVDGLPESISSLSVSDHEEPCHSGSSKITSLLVTNEDQGITPDTSAQCDPWTRPYPNAWDLFPDIVQRYANHSMFTGQRIEPRGETMNNQDKIKPAHGGWEEIAESTSTDGDDEAEDGDS